MEEPLDWCAGQRDTSRWQDDRRMRSPTRLWYATSSLPKELVLTLAGSSGLGGY
jgi:hypothetical protein